MTRDAPDSDVAIRGNNRVKASGQRRKEIFEAAAKIFAEKGYAATSIQDVADAVGILKGSLYYYIDSKEDLLFGVIQDAHETGIANLEHIAAVEGDALVKLRAAVESHVVSNVQNLAKVGVFFNDFRSLSPERHELIIKARDKYDRQFRTLIRQGQQEGVIREDIDPKIATMGILGMVNWVYQWYRPTGKVSAEEIASTFADLVLGGLAVDEGRPAARREIGTVPAEAYPSSAGNVA